MTVTPDQTTQPSAGITDPQLLALWNKYFQGDGAGQAQGLAPGFGVTKQENAAYTVYMGTTPAPDPQHINKQVNSEGDRLPGPTERDVPYDKAMTLIYHDGVQKRFVDLLIREGVIQPGNFSWDDISGWWQKAVDEAAKASKYGSKKITPYDWISMYAGVNGLGGSGSAAGLAGGTTTHTEKNVAQFDDLDARAAADEAWTSLYGKAATGKQAKALKAALNAYAQNHPSISTTTTTGAGTPNSTSSTTTKGGISSPGVQQIAEDQVKAAPGYGEYQAATTYFNALQQALGATANV